MGHRAASSAVPIVSRNSITGSLPCFRLMARLIRSQQPAHRNAARAEKLPQNQFKIPFGAWDTTEKIQAEGTVFGERVAREMRFGEQAKARDTASAWKLVPLGFADGSKLHFADDSSE
jgi:hypothetical protein